ncbi:MAG: hypothetical protein E7271_00810 [Lachnospiraceae bacterium]|nr:hypothetical protein [Lachnospiraceae bacterium]
MKLVQCRKKHYYDADKFASCPHCAVYDKTVDNTDDKEEDKPAKEVAITLEEGLADSVERVMKKINK